MVSSGFGPLGLCPQESVHRLQAAMTKTNSRSMLVQVALAIEANPWWKQQVDAYILCAPAMVEKAGQAKRHLETLASLNVCLEAIPVLLPMVHDLPDLKAALRPTSTDELFYIVFQKLMGVWGSFTAECEQKELSGEVVNDMMKLLTHASTLYPLDGSLHSMMTDCAMILQKSGKTSILKQCTEKLMAVKEAELGKINAMEMSDLESVLELQKQLQGVSLPAECFTEEPGMQALLQEILDKILAVAVGDLAPTANLQKSLTACHRCSEELLKKLEKKNSEPNVDCLGKLVQMVASFLSLTTVAEESTPLTIGLDSLEAVLSLQRLTLHVQGCMASLAPTPADFAVHVSSCKKKCEERVAKVKAMMLEHCRTHLDQHFKALRDIHSSMGEQYWLEQWKGSTMEDLVAYAGDTCMLLDGEELLRLTQQLQKACLD